MLFSTIFTLCLTSGVLAIPTNTYDALKVELIASSNNISSIDQLRLTAVVKNTSKDALKIVKYGTILDNVLPTRSFTVKKDGVAVPFTGAKLVVSTADLDETSFIIIKEGESLTVQHEVASLFNFESAGAGVYTFEPIRSLRVLSAQNAENKANVLSEILASSNKIEVAVTHNIAKPVYQDRKGDGETCTDASKQAFIDASYAEAQELASVANSYVKANGVKDALYRSYLNLFPASKVTSVLSSVASHVASRTSSCTDSLNACAAGIIAYASATTANVNYCNLFFNEQATANLCKGTAVGSAHIRGATALLELAQASAEIDDITYINAESQSILDAESIRADSFSRFAAEVYANTQC